MSKYIVDIHGEIEGDYEIIGKYVEPKTGHWTKQTLSVKPFGEDTVLCDQCAFMTDKDNTYNFCPNCGCRMSEVKQ